MKNIAYLFLYLFCALLPFAARAADMVAIDVDGGQETITIAVPSVSPHKAFLVPDPDRLVDVPSVGTHPKVALPEEYDGKLLKKLRYGQFDPDTSRFVFDLAQPIHVKDVREESARNGDLLIITIVSVAKPAEERPIIMIV